MSVRTRPALPNVKGRCRFCDKPLVGRQRSWCSNTCGDYWMAMANQTRFRMLLTRLYGKRCQECGTEWMPGNRGYVGIGGAWRPGHFNSQWDREAGRHFVVEGPPPPMPVSLEVDHIRPLWSLNAKERKQTRWWLPFNLQLLCAMCHKAKSKREAAERARLKREGALV